MDEITTQFVIINVLSNVRYLAVSLQFIMLKYKKKIDFTNFIIKLAFRLSREAKHLPLGNIDLND